MISYDKNCDKNYDKMTYASKYCNYFEIVETEFSRIFKKYIFA